MDLPIVGRRSWRRIMVPFSAHPRGALFAAVAVPFSLASAVTSILGWAGLLPFWLALPVGACVGVFLLWFELELMAPARRATPLLVLSIFGFALLLSIPFSAVALIAANARREDSASASAREREALTVATAEFIEDANAFRAATLGNIRNAREWVGRKPSAIPDRLAVTELPDADSGYPTALPPGSASGADAVAPERQLEYLAVIETEWDTLALDPSPILAAADVPSGWAALSAMYNRFMLALGHTRWYLRPRLLLPALPVPPVSGIEAARLGATEPINAAFHRLLHERKPADLWFLVLAAMLDFAPAWAAWTLGRTAPRERSPGLGPASFFPPSSADRPPRWEDRSEREEGLPDGEREARDAVWRFLDQLPLQGLLGRGLALWSRDVEESAARIGVPPATERDLHRLRDKAFAEQAAGPLRQLRQSLWLARRVKEADLVARAGPAVSALDPLAPDAADAARRFLSGLLAP